MDFSFFDNLFQNLYQFIIDIRDSILAWFSDFFGSFLVDLFEPVIKFVQEILYMFEKMVEIVVLVVKVILYLFQVLISVIGGMFNTIANLGRYTGTTANVKLGVFGQYYQQVFDIVGNGGINILAYILTVFIWFVMARAVVRMVSSKEV